MRPNLRLYDRSAVGLADHSRSLNGTDPRSCSSGSETLSESWTEREIKGYSL
ncbi:MAG: hypothetical protein LH631_07085 [Alkalinema sp. CAN_BIN05]|nr:hypothetical protein [Alkalinema sp. CAN_BIN05]